MSITDTQKPLLDGEAFTRTLTGFDSVAIKRMFGSPIGQLDEDLIPRALLFIEAKRDGMKDADAFRHVMEMPLGDVEERFVNPNEVDAGKAPTETSGPTGGPTS